MTPILVRTYSGVEVDLLDPRPEMIQPADIAHSLARLCRYTGHVECPHYAVAQHAVLVSLHVPEHLAHHGLSHDDEEAYTGDISSPMKAAMRALYGHDVFAALVRRLRQSIDDRFGLRILRPEEQALIKQADLAALATESRGDVRSVGGLYETDAGRVLPPPWPERIVPLAAEQAERLYLDRLAELWTDTTRH